MAQKPKAVIVLEDEIDLSDSPLGTGRLILTVTFHLSWDDEMELVSLNLDAHRIDVSDVPQIAADRLIREAWYAFEDDFDEMPTCH
jgi:hypothetical protein